MLLSQNNWPVLIREELVWFDAAGGRFAAADPYVAYCAAHLINQFDAKVEKIKGTILDDWSWASRPIRGQTKGYSNHASATAWDLNATQHQRGVRHTFTPDEVFEIRQILDSIKDDRGARIFRWGADYSATSTVDDMHFEINVPPKHVMAGAKLLMAKEKDMEWADKVKLTATDAATYKGAHKVNDLVSVGEIIRYPPGVLRVEGEVKDLKAQVASMQVTLKAMSEAMTALAAAVNRAVPLPEVPPHA